MEVRTGIQRPIPLVLLFAEGAEPKNRPGRAIPGDWQQKDLSAALQRFYRATLRGRGPWARSYDALSHAGRSQSVNGDVHKVFPN